MKLDSISNVKSYLINENIIHEKDEPLVERLGGGVSCNVWKITFKENFWVIKQALDKLNVEANWYSDIERIHREHEVMEALRPIGYRVELKMKMSYKILKMHYPDCL